MIFWVKTASLFLIRSKRTSIVLTLMVVSAISTLIFLASLAVGVNDAMIRNSVGLFSGHISAFNIPHEMGKKELSVKSVSNVLKRIPIRGLIRSKDKIEMISLVGIEPLEEQKTSAFWKKTVTGRFLKDNTNEIYISAHIAERLNAGPGDIVSFSSEPVSMQGSEKKDFLIAGIYKTGISQFDQGVSFCDIKILQGSLFNEKYSWNAGIFLKDSADIDIVIQKYNKKNTGNAEFKTWKEIMPDLEQLIALNYFSMSIVIIIVFVIVSLGITSAFSIFILKSIREYGIMKVMGITPFETVFLLCSEVFLINLVASIIGVILGSFIVFVFQSTGIDLSSYTSHNQYFIVSGVIFPRLTIYSLCMPPVSAFLFSIPAAVWPAAMVIRKNASQILRGN